MKKLFVLFLTIYSISAFTQKVYNFSLDNIDQENVSFNDLKGDKLTIIDFWATWCNPCKASIPKINSIYNLYKDNGVQIIGISVDSPRNRAKIKPFVNSLDVAYPVLIDKDQEVMQDFNVSSIPVLFIINSDNEIVYTHEGYAIGDEVEIEARIKELLTP